MNTCNRTRTVKRALAVAFAFGAGLAIAGAAVVAGLSWWNSRPKPWDTRAVTASFDVIDIEGAENTLVFYYVLHNNTDRDFRINSDGEVRLAGRLQRQAALTSENAQDMLKGEFPLFIPARQRARFAVHIPVPLTDGIPRGGSKGDRGPHKEAAAAFVRSEIPNLDGFVLFHELTRSQVELPNGWRKQLERR